MKKTIAIINCAVIITLLLCSCATLAKPVEGFKIVCTSFVEYDFLRNITGSENNIILLNKNGADMHGFEPTAKDIVEIRTASLFVHIGGASDKWVEKTVTATENPDLKSVALMSYVETLSLEDIETMAFGEHHAHDHSEHSHTHSAEEADEHIWLSLKNAIIITNGLCNDLCEIAPQNANEYRANATAYVAKLKALEKEYEKVFTAPERNVLLFADRFPFVYLTHDYGVAHLAAFTGCSSESEITAETFAHLIEHTNELKLPYVITLDGSDGKTAKTVCDATGAKALTVNSMQNVSITDVKSGTTYLGTMQKNLEIFKEALN